MLADACQPAAQEHVDIITASLLGRAASLEHAQTLHDGDIHYVATHILEGDGNRLSSADIWVIDGSSAYALTGSAREYSMAPDARDRWDGIMATSGAIRTELTDCVVAATRLENVGEAGQ